MSFRSLRRSARATMVRRFRPHGVIAGLSVIIAMPSEALLFVSGLP